VPRLLRVPDQLIDGLAGNKLLEQGESPHPADGGGVRMTGRWRLDAALTGAGVLRRSVQGEGLVMETPAWGWQPWGRQDRRERGNSIAKAVKMNRPQTGRISADRPGTLMNKRSGGLALGDAARELLDLLLIGAARFSALCLGSGLFSGGALHFFAFFLIFNLGGVCHK